MVKANKAIPIGLLSSRTWPSNYKQQSASENGGAAHGGLVRAPWLIKALFHELKLAVSGCDALPVQCPHPTCDVWWSSRPPPEPRLETAHSTHACYHTDRYHQESQWQSRCSTQLTREGTTPPRITLGSCDPDRPHHRPRP